MLRPVAEADRPGVPREIAGHSLGRRVVAEAVGTALLLAIVVGSGIMAERLAAGHEAVTLLANSIATGAGLVALILAFGGVSGAHLNPAVTLADVLTSGRRPGDLLPYVGAQIAGALAGVAAADLMFGQPIFELSAKPRAGLSQVFAEGVATFGLLVVAFFSSRRSLGAAAAGVGCYIAAAYWFTSSTSFANPAVTVARSLTNTFTGIRPGDVPGFLGGQLAGLAAFVPFARWLHPAKEK